MRYLIISYSRLLDNFSTLQDILKVPRGLLYFTKKNRLLDIECKWNKNLIQINDEFENVKERKGDSDAFKEWKMLNKRTAFFD